MQALWEALPAGRRGGYAETSAALEPQVLAAIRAGDAVMVKGSLGSRMGPIVKALERRYSAPRGRPQPRPRKVDPMLYWLVELSDKLSVLNVFRYITFRTGGAMITALLFVFLFGPSIIDHLRLNQGKGQPIRADGPQSHLVTKDGTPTMGGLMILSGMLVSTLLWANLANPYVWIVLCVTLCFGAGRLLRRLSEGHQADPRRLCRPHPPADRGADRRRRLLSPSSSSARSRSRPRWRFRSSRSW